MREHASVLRGEPPQLGVTKVIVSHDKLASVASKTWAKMNANKCGQESAAHMSKAWEYIHRIINGSNPTLPAKLVEPPTIPRSIQEGECLCHRSGAAGQRLRAVSNL